MTEKFIMDALMIAACVVAGASAINQMTPDADRHPKFAAWIDYLSLNVRKAQNDPHNHPWTTLIMQMAEEDGSNCGYIRPGEWQCNCKSAPCKVPPHQRTADKNPFINKDERPNRRAAIEATKRKHEERNALVG